MFEKILSLPSIPSAASPLLIEGGAEATALARSAAERAARRRSLGLLGGWVTGVFGAMTAVGVLMGDPAGPRMAVFGSWLVGYLCAAACMARGKYWASSWWVAAGGFLAVGLIQWLSGGLSSPALGGAVMLLILIGILGGARPLFVFGALSFVNLAAMGAAQLGGWLPPSVLHATLGGLFAQAAGLVGLCCAGVMVALARAGSERAASSAERLRADKSAESFEALFVKSQAPMGLTELAVRQGEEGRRLIALNESLRALFALAPEADLGAWSQIALWTRQDEIEKLRAKLRESGGFAGEKCHLRGVDGRRLVCVVGAKGVRWQGRDAILWTYQDVTELENLRIEQQKLNAELQGLNADLERRVDAKAGELDATRKELERRERLASLGETVAGVAHEINTPLGNALLAGSSATEPLARLVEMSKGSSLSRSELARLAARAKDAVDVSMGNLERAADIVKSFKQLSADQAGQTRRVFELYGVVEAALRMQAPSLKKHSATWTLAVDDDAKGLQVDGYPGALSQIVTVLGANAATHAFAGRSGGALSVRVSRAGPGRARIEFRDDGPGMSAQVAARVFEPFFTTKLGQGGTGLGLAIAWNLAKEALGGTLALEGSLDGARFVLTIPLLSPQAERDGANGLGGPAPQPPRG